MPVSSVNVIVSEGRTPSILKFSVASADPPGASAVAVVVTIEFAPVRSFPLALAAYSLLRAHAASDLPFTKQRAVASLRLHSTASVVLAGLELYLLDLVWVLEASRRIWRR